MRRSRETSPSPVARTAGNLGTGSGRARTHALHRWLPGWGHPLTGVRPSGTASRPLHAPAQRRSARRRRVGASYATTRPCRGSPPAGGDRSRSAGRSFHPPARGPEPAPPTAAVLLAPTFYALPLRLGNQRYYLCLLYTSDAADDLLC